MGSTVDALHLDQRETLRVGKGDVLVKIVDGSRKDVVVARVVKHPIACYLGSHIMPFRRVWTEANYPVVASE